MYLWGLLNTKSVADDKTASVISSLGYYIVVLQLYKTCIQRFLGKVTAEMIMGDTLGAQPKHGYVTKFHNNWHTGGTFKALKIQFVRQLFTESNWVGGQPNRQTHLGSLKH